MNSRLERYNYDEEVTDIPSRVAKNKDLYNDVSVPEYSRIKPNNNVRVLETTSSRIDLNKIKKYIETNEEEEEVSRSVVVKKDIEVLPQKGLFDEEKDYDINSVLEKAKENRETYYEDEKHKKLRDTQYDILSKIKMYDEDEFVEAGETEETIKLNTNEQTLIDLINTVTKKKEDLLDALKMGSENTIVTAPIDDESNDKIISKAIEEAKEDTLEATIIDEKSFGMTKEDVKNQIKDMKKSELEKDLSNTNVKGLDQSFYTNSMSFSKNDFEGFEELEKTVKKNNILVKITIFMLILLAIVTVFVILKYVLNII